MSQLLLHLVPICQERIIVTFFSCLFLSVSFVFHYDIWRQCLELRDDKKTYLFFFQRFIMLLTEHLVRCETSGVDSNTTWYKNCIERLQQIFLMVVLIYMFAGLSGVLLVIKHLLLIIFIVVHSIMWSSSSIWAPLRTCCLLLSSTIISWLFTSSSVPFSSEIPQCITSDCHTCLLMWHFKV